MIEDNSFHPLQRVKTKTNNVIISEKELNYVETLYISYIHKIDFNDYISIVNVIYDLEAKGLGFSNGRTWFEFSHYRIGVMDYEKSVKTNNYIFEIQYKYKHLFEIRGDLSLLEFPFFLSDNLEDYRIKRIDITKIMKIQNFDFSPLNIGYISRMRKLNWYENTLYIGSRKSGQVMRIYNKSKEIEDKRDLEKEKLLNSYFDNDLKNLITVELELRAKVLKEKYGIITLDKYKKAIKIYNDVVGAVALYELNDKNRKLRKQQHQNRIKKYYLEKYEEVERMQRDKYYYSQKQIQERRVLKEFKRYIDLFGDTLTDELEIIAKMIKLTKIKNYSLEIEDTEEETAYNKMMQRLKEFDYEFHTHLQSEAEYYLTYKHINTPYFKKS